jgi:hypothetical protein
MTADAPSAGRAVEQESGFDLPIGTGTTVVSVGCDAEFFRPIRVGDRLNVEEELVDVSGLKHTRLGDGHFLTTAATYRLGDGTPVARYSHQLFRFTPSGDRDAS